MAQTWLCTSGLQSNKRNRGGTSMSIVLLFLRHPVVQSNVWATPRAIYG